MNEIEYKELEELNINMDLFATFKRHQVVKKCWRKENGNWVLKDIAFTEFWSQEEYAELVRFLKNTLETGGKVLAAIHKNQLVGFASVENMFLGSHKDYIQLSCLHTSHDHRGMGIGKKLFALTCEKAKELGAKKLYISAHSAEETQAFYKAMGCVEAVEYNERLVAEEPYDCQLEYCLV